MSRKTRNDMEETRSLKRVTCVVAIIFLAAATVPARAQGSNPAPRHVKSADEMDAETIAGRARALLNKGEYRAAEEIARTGLFTWKTPGPHMEDTAVKRALAEALLRQGQDRQAIALEKEVYSFWHDKYSRVRIGILLCRLGKYDESRQLFDKELVISTMPPDSRSMWKDPGNMTALEGDWLLAAGLQEDANGPISPAYYYEAAIKRIPSNGYLTYALGQLYARNRKYASAAVQFRKAAANSVGVLKRAAGQALKEAEYRAKSGNP
jgi:tetratricopeptide (TPR) repeat protein